MVGVLLFFLLACSSGEKSYEWHGTTMGTFYQVRVVHAGKLDKEEQQTSLVGVIERVNSLMSNWQPDSEVSRFNALDSTQPFAVSEDTARVVRRALELAQKTGGALDPTVSPLIELWGFGTRKDVEFPAEAEVTDRMARIGYNHLHVEGNTLRKDLETLTLNLSSIAKGYAVDCVALYLQGQGFDNYMINIGGEVLAAGHNPEGEPWRMAVEEPNYQVIQKVHRVFDLKGKALATSGDYRIFFEHEGKKYTHILDPRTGYPVEHGIASASVIADDCMTADALATALIVLSPEEGLALAASMPGIECLLLVREKDETLKEHKSAGLDDFVTP